MPKQLTKNNLHALADYAVKVNKEITTRADELYRLLAAANVSLFDSSGQDPLMLLDQAIDSLDDALEILRK